MTLTFFGTDGIRGPYGSPSLNDAIAFRAGRAAVLVAKRELGIAAPRILVGRDTRASGSALQAAFSQGVVAEGGRALDLGVAPTPCVAYASRICRTDFACSITASHNPARDNGLKFFQGDGVKPSEAVEAALDAAIGALDATQLDPLKQVEAEDVSLFRDAYSDALVAHFPAGLLAGKRVALDCANGAMSDIAPSVFRALGAEVETVACEPDGGNINAGVGSEHPGSLARLFAQNRFDFGFAFDGDGDRVILSDECGRRVPGEAVLAALAIDAAGLGALPESTLVTTVQSNLGLDAALKRCGIRVARTDVGDKHIARLMIAKGYLVGGEESGHVVLGAFAVTGDGLFAAAKLAELAATSGRSISELTKIYSPFPQQTLALKVAAKPPLESCPNLWNRMAGLSEALGGDGRILVRYSGTEPKLRLLVEAKTDQLVRESMESLLAAVRLDLAIA